SMTTATGSLTFALSRLARPAAGEGFDDIRLAMVDRLIEASGNGTLDGAAWLQHWQAAATEMTDRIMTTAADQVEIAAARSRMSAARANALMPGASDRNALLNRLLAEGTALEELEHGQQPDLRR